MVRYGGDEFVMAFKNISVQTLRKRMERVRRAITEITLEEYPDVKLTMSFGVKYGTDIVKNMIEEADNALYESKKTRNTVTVIC